MNLFFSIIQILRPLNIILCFITVLIATFLLDEFQSPILFYTLIVVCCFAGASNILNDVLDIEIDKINKSKRVLPSGHLDIRSALFLMCILYTIGILASTYVNPLGRQIALIIALPILVLYTPLFKRLPLIGNFVVGSMLGLVFLFSGASISGSTDKMWIPFFLATSLSTIRELCKDSEDIIGDSAKNIQTFPLKYGLIKTLWILRIFCVSFCVFALIPWTNGSYGMIYLITLIVSVEIPLLYGVFILIDKKSDQNDYSRFAKALKGITIAGIFVILTSTFSY